MRPLWPGLVMLLGLGVSATAFQEPVRRLASEELRTRPAALTVTSESFAANQPIPSKHADEGAADAGENVSPQVSWTAPPEGTESVVVMLEDPDARAPKPFVHWLLYNLPASLRALPESLPGTLTLPAFGGALQGRNHRGTIGYFGPRPPKDDPPHHYHLQVLAVDRVLALDPGASPAVVLGALRGHVLASGSLVGTYRSR